MHDQDRRAPVVQRVKGLLEVVATVMVIVVAATILWRVVFDGRRSATVARGGGDAALNRRPPVAPPLPKEPLSLTGAAVKGNPQAKVALIEYSDFQCPYCGKFALETLPVLDRDYVTTGKVLFAFRHMPLDALHPAAKPAAEAAECARRQGRFWQVHDRLFATQRDLRSADFRSLAGSLGLDVLAFDECAKGSAPDVVVTDTAAAKALGISGTPTFLVGIRQPDGRVQVRERLVGALSPEGFGKVIENLLRGD